PDALEPLVLKQLAEPRYNVFKVQTLIREQLYPIKDSKARKALVDAFLKDRGEVWRQGIVAYLFGDLDSQEAEEEGRMGGQKLNYDARACLIEVFGYPKEVRSKDQPEAPPLENCTQARFIDTLGQLKTPKIDAAVREVLHSTDEEYLVKACSRYL